MDEPIKKRVDESWKESIEKEKGADTGHSEAAIEVNFQLIVTTFMMEALVALGEVAHPVAKTKETNIAHAKFVIDILSLLEDAVARNLIPVNKPVKIHIKLDTGMHRLGFEKNHLDELISRLNGNERLYVQSVFSHLAGSDEDVHDDFTRNQIACFEVMSKKLQNAIDHPILRHILNSSGIDRFPEAQFDMVRLGIGLYGIASEDKEQVLLANVSRLKSSISQIKNISAGDSIGYGRKYYAESDMTIAVVPIGYADGLSRKFSNGNGIFTINNEPVPIVGNICMDMCMVDITNIQAKEGDEVIIFNDSNSIISMAEQLETIPYEILTGISRRVKRVYFQE